MKILHLITSIDKGGAETNVINLAKIQSENNLHVLILYAKGEGYWKKKINLKFKNIRQNFFFITFISDIYNLTKSIKKFRPDIINVHLPYMEICLFFSLFFLKKNFKIVCTKHLDNNLFDSLFKNNFFLANFLTKIVCRKYEKIIAISNAVKKFYVKNKIIEDLNKIKVVYYGISLVNKNKFKKNLDLKKKFNLSNKTFLIGTISRLVPQKSLNYLIDSFDIYNKKLNNNSKLIIVGKGFQKKQLKNYAFEKKINDKIIWIDFIEDTDNFISQLNAFALSSKYEGLGQVLLEALRVGTPIVASARGAIPEVIQNNYNGRLAPYNKPKKFAKLFDNLPKSKFKKNGHKILNSKFNEKTMFLKTMKIYKELIK